MTGMHRWLPLALLLFLVACATPTGSLQIDVRGLPTGQDASITITGPNNYGQSVTESTTLTGLTPGTYEFQAPQISTTAITSEHQATITPQSLDVVAGETATVSVQYTLRAGTLTISINGLPAGVDADVSIAGPDAFTQNATTTTTLDVPPGEYTATADPVTDGTDTYAPTITNSPAEVSSASGASIEVTYTLDTGSLQVTISGLPAGVDGNVLVEGANGFSEVVSADTTLTGLVPGLYRVTTRNARIDHPIVSEALGARVGVMAVEVTSNSVQSVRTSYSLIPSSGRLWTPHNGTTVTTGIAADALKVDGSSSPTPDATITSGLHSSHDGIAFDAAGNAWITNQFNGTLERYLASDLATDGSPSPNVTISGLTFPVGLAFDRSGNLWVTDLGNHTVAGFTPDQLESSGSPPPAVTISNNNGSVYDPSGLAFDAEGNLWVANTAEGTVVRFGADQLLSGGSLVPEVTISEADGNLPTPVGVAFDAEGSLWVTSINTHLVLKFEDPGLLSGVVSPNSAVVLGGLDWPTGVAFDEGGSLWVVNGSPDELLRFDNPGDWSGPVLPMADAVIDPDTQVNYGLLAFFPPPADLPIVTP